MLSILIVLQRTRFAVREHVPGFLFDLKDVCES